MADLSISPEEIRGALDSFMESYRPADVATEEVGHVIETADGIAHVEGLPGTMANELLRFEDGTLGLAMNLDQREIGAVVLGDFGGIEEGQVVHRTGEVLSVPVGDGYLGRTVDPLGRPIDGLGEITDLDGRRALELQAPGVMARKSVHEPLATGLKAIDSMIPVGRGQRQLIIGDRKTGKTAIALDTILNQRENWKSGDPNKQVRCIYVAIGQKGSTIASVRSRMREPWSTRPSSPPRPRTPPATSTWLPTPAPPSASTGCIRASMSSSSSTICPSRPRPTVRCRCCCVARRAAKPTPATSSTCTPACWSVARSSRTPSVAVR